MTNQTKINELVKLLDNSDKAALQELNQKYPEYKEFLKPLGIPLKGGKIDENEYKFKIEVSIAGLQSAIANCEKILPILKTRLKRLNNVQLFSQIIVLISGATILSLIQTNFGPHNSWIKYIAPSLVLISSVLNIIAKNKSESFLFGNKNLYEISSSLITGKNEANELISDLKLVSQFFNTDKAEWANTSIARANALAKNINDYMDSTGIV